MLTAGAEPRRPRRRAAAVGVALSAIAVAGCGASSHHAATPPTSEAATTSTSSTTAGQPATPAAAVSPLTGLPPQSAAQLRAPAVVVKIDNVAGALPQTGVVQADVVYEEMVEGGLTRLAAVYQSVYPAQVGPVRSGRLTDIALADDLNHPVLAFAGANAIFLPQLRAQPIQDIDIDNRPDLFVRQGPHVVPHNLYTSPAADAAVDVPSAPPAPLFAYRPGSAPLTNPGVGSATSVSVGWPATSVSWTYSAAAGVYTRVQNGAPDTDITGRQVTATNVIVQPVQYTTSATGYESGVFTIIPEGQLLGTGPVWVLSGGKVVQGTWKRTSLTTPATYTDSAGQPIPLAPGNTWVELTNAGTLPLLK
ncbi:DUF3048 domain-containing protein [Acidiferrimicrobium sp. IK]|uniref:DUF3048 domain-containing protein n=1 Tax=Acidiferrimicrobium sp. IK TaxID=2871700 RepID=UPI0021CB19B9|nr:DUF3048 domain-containing protein [Acidiferrimicrobium sp. IK]MCU4187048.1 DUF3048 domain-containing protein [Acidiferrimicrobium sp. IK]